MRNGAQRRDGRDAMTEIVDLRRGRVRASGTLTAQGADLLRGTVECLRRGGHSVVLLDLGDVRIADSAGLQDLRALERSMSAEGGLLRLIPPPDGPAPGR